MIELNQTNRLLQQLMGKLDTIIEQNEKIISMGNSPTQVDIKGGTQYKPQGSKVSQPQVPWKFESPI